MHGCVLLSTCVGAGVTGLLVPGRAVPAGLCMRGAAVPYSLVLPLPFLRQAGLHWRLPATTIIRKLLSSSLKRPR